VGEQFIPFQLLLLLQKKLKVVRMKEGEVKSI
jgi:hypothetical protein